MSVFAVIPELLSSADALTGDTIPPKIITSRIISMLVAFLLSNMLFSTI
jgi:hypothetical protein